MQLTLGALSHAFHPDPYHEYNFRGHSGPASWKGDYEAVELRDNDKKSYCGNGVLRAVSNVQNTVVPALMAKKFNVATDLVKIDDFIKVKELYGTDDKSKLGAKAILGISMACTRAGTALALPYITPVPFFNLLNGGIHLGNLIAFHGFMIAQVGATSLTDTNHLGSDVYQWLKSVLKPRFGDTSTGVGNEGGFAHPISAPQEALHLFMTAVERCNYVRKLKFGMDPASSEFLSEGHCDLKFKDSNIKKLSSKEMQSFYNELLEKYSVELLEDPFGQDDWDSWVEFQRTCKIELVGDDLLDGRFLCRIDLDPCRDERVANLESSAKAVYAGGNFGQTHRSSLQVSIGLNHVEAIPLQAGSYRLCVASLYLSA
ncbi:Enolase, C-terminal TIM barrel domain-containing protein [Calycina marina]|uniref:phosphopyruvate hydratase n=1 Tax=Calycina marina TaxID=1763456 RepID=A0A9P7YXY0_9HELO|nr:Enolase, C-terminal TIM barrel domain-containing protein [Calycina marina]